MTGIPKWGGVISVLFLSLFLYGCTRPEDNAIKPLKQYVPPPDSNRVAMQHIYTPKTYTVEISGMKFQPAEITVHTADTVVWRNNDLVAHCVTELNTNAWTSGKLPPGKLWKIAVDKSYVYFCAIHVVMKGKITLQ